ncbi:MAG: hypothetical protein MI867_23780 [Pseudomonadales bacterium]|nr:hypothetical protein [Pseudomonadales bacterium]
MDESKEITYEISFAKSDDVFVHTVSLEPDALEHFVLVEDAPEWCDLEYKRCSNCPLDTDTQPHCPLALRLIPFVEMKSCVSYDEVDCKVSMDDKTIQKQTSAQEAFSSLIGLVMATSGCPHTSFFKPMAWFHQPFASEYETIMRACSNFLLSKHFEGPDAKNHSEHSDLFEELKKIYEEIHQINIQISKRIQRDSLGDSTLNAIVLLDIFTADFAHALEDDLSMLKQIFGHNSC